MTNPTDWTGRRFRTRDARDGDRTVEIVREVSGLRDDRVFVVRNVTYTKRPDLVGRESQVSAAGLRRRYREETR
ncbi:hypothetical protein AB0O99_04090 [Cellulosimicrobium funkei]|uniref:hypothetical protein n=1 Tax=Cellulosimicrobium funkei TaxID=264251 RepID=UPI003419799A